MPSTLTRLRRTRPYLTPPWVEESDEPNIEKIWRLGDPLLRRSEPVPEVAPPVLTRNIDPLASIVPLPAPITPLERPAISDADVNAIGAPPMILRRDGRPTESFIGEGDPLDRAIVRRDALQSYEPKKESKKHLLARTLLNFAMGGAPAAVGTLGAGLLDRRGIDRQWKEGELAKANEQIGQGRLLRRTDLQDRLLESQVAENEAQALRALREPADKDLIVGGSVLRRNPAGGYETVFSAPTKPETPTDRTVGNTILRRQPDGSYQPVYTAPDKADASEFNNDQIASTISQIEAEQKTLGPSPPTEIDDVTLVENSEGVRVPTVTGKKVNPTYLDWARRYRELDDQKRQLQMKRKPTLTRRDPSVQTYADKFFKGDYDAAMAAIKKQRGQ